MISEIKLDSSFPKTEFLIEGYTAPYRFVRTVAVGNLLYIRSEILLKGNYNHRLSSLSAGFFVELILKQIKSSVLHIPNNNLTPNHLIAISKGLDPGSSRYKHFLMVFNMEHNENLMKVFLISYNISNIIKDVGTCFKKKKRLILI